MVIFENIDTDTELSRDFWINIKKEILENINIDKEILQNIDIDKILYGLYGISNRAWLSCSVDRLCSWHSILNWNAICALHCTFLLFCRCSPPQILATLSTQNCKSSLNGNCQRARNLASRYSSAAMQTICACCLIWRGHWKRSVRFRLLLKPFLTFTNLKLDIDFWHWFWQKWALPYLGAF